MPLALPQAAEAHDALAVLPLHDAVLPELVNPKSP